MKIGSININGVNGFSNRNPGAWEFFGYFCPDILCIQETKGDKARVDACLKPMMDAYNYVSFVSASKGKKGYAGVGLLVKPEILERLPVIKSVELIDNLPEDHPMYSQFLYYGTGRIIQYEDNDMRIVTVYTLNSGGKDELRVLWDSLFLDYIKSLLSDSDKPLYILGDFNVCHKEIDMWNWRNSLNTYPGLMEYEISGFSKLLEETQLKDSFRELHPNEVKYSWSAPKVPLSKGWRLDYALTNRLDSISDSTIVSDVRSSDHVYIELILK